MRRNKKYENELFLWSQADQFNFIRIPKELVVGEAFASLSVQAKILYGMLLDRMGMSYKNKWMDEENRVYIVYSLDEIQSDMNVSSEGSCRIVNVRSRRTLFGVWGTIFRIR